MAQARIVEQPTRETRFRYKTEQRPRAKREIGGNVAGVRSTNDQKTYPSIEISCQECRVTVSVFCVTPDADEQNRYKPHPFQLVGTYCKNGYYKKRFKMQNGIRVIKFDDISIQCVKKEDIEEAIRHRRSIGQDPFETGFDHIDKTNKSTINMDAVRLCFVVAVHEGNERRALPPMVSDVIQDSKKVYRLRVKYFSHVSAPVNGGVHDLIMLGEFTKLKKQITVKYFDELSPPWEMLKESKLTFPPIAIVVEVPPYRDMRESRNDHKVQIQIWDQEKDIKSVAYDFTYTALYTGAVSPLKPRQRVRSPSECENYIAEKRKKTQSGEVQQLLQTSPDQQPLDTRPVELSSTENVVAGSFMLNETHLTKTNDVQNTDCVNGCCNPDYASIDLGLEELIQPNNSYLLDFDKYLGNTNFQFSMNHTLDMAHDYHQATALPDTNLADTIRTTFHEAVTNPLPQEANLVNVDLDDLLADMGPQQLLHPVVATVQEEQIEHGEVTLIEELGIIPMDLD